MSTIEVVSTVAEHAELHSPVSLQFLLPSARDSSSSISLFSAIFWFWLWLFFKIMNIFLYYIPNIIVNLFSVNFQITLSLSSIVITLTGIISFCFLIVRYKYLTRYSKTTKSTDKPKSSNKNIDLVGSIKKNKRGDSKSTSNYLDEFLSAIKVFGYLERPVFHELTRNMTTQKLSLEEILYLDEKLGFLIVVEGTIQVYTKVNSVNSSATSNSDDNELNFEKDDLLTIGDQCYQLLNEVKSGSPLSSLMSTLDLFKPVDPDTMPNRLFSPFELDSNPASNPLSPDNTGSKLFDPLSSGNYNDTPLSSSDRNYPNIVARPKPTEDSNNLNTATIAIIPYLAFQKVQSKYPKATSHIVTMVITRLYKITMNTIHSYLGLTREIIHSEIQLNESEGAKDSLPSYLYDGVIEKFYGNKNKETLLNKTAESPSVSINKTSSSSSSLPKKSTTSLRPLNRNQSSRYVVLDSRSKSTHPGDLLSSVPLSRRSDYYQTHTTIQPDPKEVRSQSRIKMTSPVLPKRQISSNGGPTLKRHSSSTTKFENIRDRTFSDEREETEETSLRIAIIENIFKILGINEVSNMIGSMSDLNSRSSSVNSSVVGLPSLMNNGNESKYPNGIFDYNTGRVRYDSISSFPTSLNKGATNNLKFYNTVNQSQLKDMDHENDKSSQVDINNLMFKRKSIPIQSFESNFYDVKNEFSKHLDIKYFGPNTTLVEQESFNSGIYYVIDGTLDVFYKPASKESENLTPMNKKKLYTVKPGGLAGYLSSIIGFRSLVSISTPGDKGVIVAHIPKNEFSKLLDKFYFLQLPVASKLKSLLSSQILTIDYALEWCHIPAGDVLCSQGDLANGFHIVLSGRFRVVRYNNNKSSEVNPDDNTDIHDYNNNLIDESLSYKSRKKKDDITILGEYGHGETIGEVEVLTASRRTNSLIAVRDSETARIPRTLFEMLSLRNPSIMVKVSRIVANKMAKKDNIGIPSAISSNVPLIVTNTDSHISNDYKTITILPTVSGLPVRDFADKLVLALKNIGRNVIALDQASTLTHLGRHAFDERLAQLKLSGYFAYLEEEYQTIVYVCDTPLKSNWTSTCISQGDCILLLADADDDDVATNIGEYERLLMKLKTTARTDLCLIHADKYVEPGSTSVWLKNRIWVQGHHHIQMEIARDNSVQQGQKTSIIKNIAAKISSRTNPNIKSRLENVKTKAILSLNKFNNRLSRRTHSYKTVQAHKNDFLRLARILSNESVGLVLGGGGSRGISHVGVVMALEKHGIPIDLIGGTSIGSFVGGLYAKDYNIVSIYGRAKRFAKRVSSWWRMVLDLTYPVTSYITGYEFNRGIWKIFGSSEIEDFWIRYFCNSTNITNSTMDIHESGFLWRFIRASMSLAGLLPPITYGGSMLLDGGYLDNLPVMEMKKKGAKYIIAVDVGSVDDRTPMNYGDTLSGFWVLFNRWNPFSRHPNVPNMMDIQLRLAYVASVNALELAKKTPGVIYLRPPIDDYATLDFAKFDEIYHVGMAYADNLLTRWEQTGKIPPIAGMIDRSRIRNGEERKSLYRRSSI